MLSARSVEVRLPRDDDIAPPRQRFELGGKGVPGFAPHDDGAAQCDAFEVRQVFWQMPWQCVVLANHAIGSAGKNQMQLHKVLHGNRGFNRRV